MKRVEVLLVKSTSGNKILDVYLHNPETGVVLHEDVDTFMYRTVLPHAERLELREISHADERFQEAFWYLGTIPLDNTRDFREYDIAFKEIFEVATGYYSPKNPRPFTVEVTDEKIIHAAVIFPEVDGNGNIYKETMFLASRHAHCFERAAIHQLKYDKSRTRQGFYTDCGRFVDRYEAKKLALSNGQLPHDTEHAELYSEDLW